MTLPFWTENNALDYNKLPPEQKLRDGCYFLKLNLQNGEKYEGTLRLESNSTSTKASGDVYLRRNPSDPNLLQGVPWFRRDQYAGYLSVEKFDLDSFSCGELEFQYSLIFYDHLANTWSAPNTHIASLNKQIPPGHYPDVDNFYTGNLLDQNNIHKGEISIGWVSPYLRKAKVTYEAVEGLKIPTDDGGSLNWRKVFDEVKWDMELLTGSKTVPPPPGSGPHKFWTLNNLHSKMLEWKHNKELMWNYHLLIVNFIKGESRGIMYDSHAIDSNKIPREGASVCTDWGFPDNPEEWGPYANKKFGDAPKAFFRTAIHEIGHAMGLTHNQGTGTFMNTTDQLTSPRFPNNINWRFTPDNEDKLKHFPDLLVRPGNAPVNIPMASLSDQLNAKASKLEFKIAGARAMYPYGGPIRIEMTLTNNDVVTHEIPRSMSLKSDFVSGYSEDTAGVKRFFKSIIACSDDQATKDLIPKKKDSYSATLFRGESGWLFPSIGPYTVVFNLRWMSSNGQNYYSTAACKIMIDAPKDEAHAALAFRIMDSPDLMMSFIVGGKEFEEGDALLKDIMGNKTLKGHYAFLDFKNKLKHKTKKVRDAAWNKLDKQAVLSKREKEKVKKEYKEAKAECSKKSKSRTKVSQETLRKNLNKFAKAFPDLGKIV